MLNRTSRKLRATAVAVLALLTLGGCAQGLGGGAYSRTEARRAMTVQFGTIESVRAVQLEGTKTPIGPVAGAAVGAGRRWRQCWVRSLAVSRARHWKRA